MNNYWFCYLFAHFSMTTCFSGDTLWSRRAYIEQILCLESLAIFKISHLKAFSFPTKAHVATKNTSLQSFLGMNVVIGMF